MLIDDLPIACTYWLEQNLAPVIAGVNAKITARYTVDTPALFTPAVVIGEIAVTSAPTICVWSDSGSQPIQLDMNGQSPESAVSIVYKIRVVLPNVANGNANTVANFELSKQCALGGLALFFWDKRNSIQPTVFTKYDPDDPVQAMASKDSVGPWRSMHLKPLADNVTVVRSLEMTFLFQFGICDDTVLSSP